jgi:hypothetical protein
MDIGIQGWFSQDIFFTERSLSTDDWIRDSSKDLMAWSSQELDGFLSCQIWSFSQVVDFGVLLVIGRVFQIVLDRSQFLKLLNCPEDTKSIR